MGNTQVPDLPDPIDSEEELAGPFTTELELTLPMPDVEAEVVVYDRNGEVWEGGEIGRIVIRPIFFTATQVVNALYARLSGTVKGEQSELQRFVLTVSGTTGRCKMLQRTSPVTPAFSAGLGAPADDEEDNPGNGPPQPVD